MPWQPPDITLRWGNYFRPDVEEQAKLVGMVQEAMGKGGTGEKLITLRTGVEKLAPHFGIEDVDSYLEQLEEEQQKADERALEQSTAELEAAHKLAGSIDGDGGAKRGPGAGGRPNPPQAPGGRGGGAAAAPPKGKNRAP